MNLRRKVATVFGAATLASAISLSAVACGSGNNFRDVEGVRSERPDSIQNFNNMDQHPNISKICIDGVAFATTTREYDAIMRVPEWDKHCPVG